MIYDKVRNAKWFLRWKLFKKPSLKLVPFSGPVVITGLTEAYGLPAAQHGGATYELCGDGAVKPLTPYDEITIKGWEPLYPEPSEWFVND